MLNDIVAKLATMDRNIAFANWVENEMDYRGWSRSDLAHNANVSPAAISDILNGRRSAGIDLCVAIAKAFRMPPEYVLRKASLLPPSRDEVDELDEIGRFLLRQLKDPENKQQAIEYLRFLRISEEKGESRVEANKKPTPATSDSNG